MDIMKMMKQAKELQSRMKATQDELAKKEFTGSSGGGSVSVSVKGDFSVSAVKIKPEVLKENDHELLEDLVFSAMSQAIESAKSVSQEEMGKLSGMMNLPF